MTIRTFMTTLLGVLVAVFGNASNAAGNECAAGTTPSISFVQFQSPNLAGATPAGDGPAAFEVFMANERKRMGAVIVKSGIVLTE